MRLLLLTGLLFFQLFLAPRSEAGAPARFCSKDAHKEARFSRTVTVPVAEDVHHHPEIGTATQQRRHLATGGLTVPPLILSRATLIPSPANLLGKASFCTPIALRLLFPRHYFW